MGNSRWDPKDWATYSAGASTKTQAEIFKSTSLAGDLDPTKFDVRESRDSDANPLSTPIILASDVTGSMGYLAEEIAKRGMGVIMREIYERKPVTDPHVMVAAIGDVTCDRSPIQMTQFEASVDPLTTQIEKIHLERGGGGNNGESYNAILYGAAYKTSCDAMIKRGRKGYIFTIGDEPPLMSLSKTAIKRFFGHDVEADMSTEQLLNTASQNWEVFHLLVGNYAHRTSLRDWRDLLGERAIEVSDHKSLAEVVVSTIQVIEGADADAVAKSWSGDTSVVVRKAVSGLTANRSGSGVVAL